MRVIILTDAPMVKPANKLIDIIASAKGKGCFKSANEIEQFIRHERNQWVG